MKTQRIQTIERRLLIAFQTKRKELLFRFSVSYVTVNTHPSTFPVPLFLTSFSYFMPDLSICSSITRFSLVLFLSLHIFSVFILFPHFVAVHITRNESISVDMTQGMKSFVPCAHPKKEKSRFKAITSALIRIKRRVTVPCHAMSFERDAKRKNTDKFEKLFLSRGVSKLSRFSILYCKFLSFKIR